MTGLWSYSTAFSRHDGLLTAQEQQRLRQSRVAIVGMGGVGGVHLATLGRLGIGKFTITDLDEFEMVNINRQYGARMDTIGRPKVDVMAEEIQQINPEVDLRILDSGVTAETVDDFLQDADLLIDGIDFFEIDMRRRLFRQAAANGIHAITAGPLGFSAAWLTFAPDGMSFDRYFDFNDRQSYMEQLAAFTVGLAPRSLHVGYLDLKRISIAERRAPSTGLACQLCAGITAAVSLKILLGRGRVRCAPSYAQFDAYRGLYRGGRLRGGNRHPMQLLKRWLLQRKVAASEVLPTRTQTVKPPQQSPAVAATRAIAAREDKQPRSVPIPFP